MKAQAEAQVLDADKLAAMSREEKLAIVKELKKEKKEYLI